MKYEKLEERARGMTALEVEDTFRSLVNDARFAAVVAVLVQHRDQFVDGGCVQQLANSHGSLAHNAGSVYALNVLLGKIRQVSNPPKKRAEQKPEAD